VTATAGSETQWHIQLLGGLAAVRGEERITRFRSQRMASLLAYLAYYARTRPPRHMLVELLWPGCDPDAGRHNLSVALSRLREQFPWSAEDGSGSIFIADRFSVGIDPAAISTDVGDFEALIRRAAGAQGDGQFQFLTEAIDQYRGALLPGYYDEWILPEQRRLDELFFQAIGELIAHCEQTRDSARAFQYAHRALRADPLREEAHRELIRLHLAAGQPGAALRQYRELERMLAHELGIAPSPATRALMAAIEAAEMTPARPRVGACGNDREVLVDQPSGSSGMETTTPLPVTAPDGWEPIGGAVPLGSALYVRRAADEQFAAALARQESIVLVKGPRRVGKTSLLARGLEKARQAGARVVLTDLSTLNQDQFESAERLLRGLAQMIGDQLELDIDPAEGWDTHRGPNLNFQRFLRRGVLGAVATPMVWGLDEVDRLFHYPFGSELFALFRFWHNERALDPGSPWARLTLAIAYATEAHLFITDLNKSPFNVGARLTLDDFTPEETADLNCRCGAPLRASEEVAGYHQLVGGHPYLVRRGLDEMTTQGMALSRFEAQADRDDGPFGSHLQRLRDALLRDSELCAAVRSVLSGQTVLAPRDFYRLRTAGLLSGESEADARLRCPLYAAYLKRHL
jgi:DNA-binding SARP family transcriptional activator